MRRRFCVSMVSATLLLGLVVPASLAADPQSRFERIPVSGLKALVTPGLLNGGRVVNVMVELAGQPVAVQDAQASATGRHLTKDQKAAIRASLKAAQGHVVSAVTNAGGVVVGQLADAYNGVHARVPLAAVAQLQTLPGVVAVHGVQTFTRSNGAAVPYIGASEAWAAGGLTGKGVFIASIDTGIDYYHANFGGSGLVPDFAYGAAHSTTAPAYNADGITMAFPSAKVPKGYDFVGDTYDAAAAAGSPNLIPHPDPNPLDCAADLGGGHGSHTAGSAAGEGVLSSGATFTGPYDANVYTAHTFNVAPGAAPQATIYAYRVFGCSGPSDVVAEAIDQAVADGANVISMSLGSPFGREDDPTSVAANNAAAAGIVVVASAGNEGPNAYMVGSPSTASRVISVAAVDASRATFNGGSIGLPNGAIIGIDANDGPLPVTGAIKVLKNPDGTISLGCSASEYAGTAGTIVVTVRGTCDRVARAKFGQTAGATAVIMINNSAGLPPFEGPIAGVSIPFIGVAQGTDADFLAADGATVTISPTPVTNTGYQKTASFSSGGPRNGDSAPKPDVTAPGVSVFSTGVGTGTGGVYISGTSMACPLVAGSAALVHQAHPLWSPDAVKAALMGTADATTGTIVGYNVRLDGTGVVQAQRAVSTVAYATTSDHLDSLAFGYQPLGGAFTETKSFSLNNTSGSPITYTLATSDASGVGAAVDISPNTVNVPANGTADVNVTISLSAAAVSALLSTDTFAVGAGAVATARGVILATPTSTGAGIFALRVPYLLAPRALSNVVAGARAPYANHADIFTSSVKLTNTSGVFGGTADVYAWGLSGPNTVSRLDDTQVVRSVGVQSLPGDTLGSSASDRSLIFAINTWGRWSTPSSNEFDIAIDTNKDGNPDFLVVGFDLGQLLSGTWDGRYASFTLDASGNLIDAFLADAPMNGSTVELPVLASDLGLSAAKPTFSYAAAGFSVENGAADFVPGTATFNAFAPTISTGDFLVIPAGTSATLGLTLDRHRFDTASALGWMVVSLDDANGAAQADLIPVGKLNPKH